MRSGRRSKTVSRDELEAFAKTARPRVLRFLTKRLGPREDLEDLVQLVFVELLVALPRFRGDSSLSTFVHGIAAMVARRANRGTAWEHRRTELPEDMCSTDHCPREAFEQRERARRLHVVLGGLTEKKRNALTLWAVQGHTPKEISDMTSASVPAVRSQIFYAQKELRDRARRDPYLSLVAEEVRKAA